MPNQFLLIIKKTDEGKFSWFKNKRYNKQTNEILKKNDSKYVWGLHKGVTNNAVWNKIKKNDRIYLTVEKETFKISGNVFKKIKNLKYGELIYPESSDRKQINYFLFFDKLDSCREPFEVLKNKSKPSFSNEGIFEIKEESPHKRITKIKVKKLPRCLRELDAGQLWLAIWFSLVKRSLKLNLWAGVKCNDYIS